MVARLAVCVLAFVIYGVIWSAYSQYDLQRRTELATQVLNGGESQPLEHRLDHKTRNDIYAAGLVVLAVTSLIILSGDIKRLFSQYHYTPPIGLAAFLMLPASGCWRPYEPNLLETIGPSEEAFLIPLVGETEKQSSTHSEELLEKSLVQAKQVRIPQQWVQTGYEFGLINNGSWRDAGVLIKVDRAPVTREWTADTASGTSHRNEAIWVMTSDQVEFSTGWTCTASISTRADAVKFLYFYRGQNIADTMDREVRARIQTAFGIEVTDQPMSKLRSEAMPHIKKVVDDVTLYFKERGLTIMNLGITGGFVYKDKTIQDTLVTLFNAEQEKAIADARAQALQKEAGGKADAAKLAAEGEAEATKLKAQAEADAIRAVAESKAYEIEKAAGDLPTYMALKQLEIEKQRVEKWGGAFPQVFVGDVLSQLFTFGNRPAAVQPSFGPQHGEAAKSQ